jgi:hypothetical protein
MHHSENLLESIHVTAAGMIYSCIQHHHHHHHHHHHTTGELIFSADLSFCDNKCVPERRSVSDLPFLK